MGSMLAIVGAPFKFMSEICEVLSGWAYVVLKGMKDLTPDPFFVCFFSLRRPEDQQIAFPGAMP
jgi:hypothetical protein